ncbi:MAG: hypothetical protein EPN43_04065 [Jatrophihabitans sp.]|nr:MAG: hypothetical protein EPN43_04065 [Jatrophihabitans sp.]
MSVGSAARPAAGTYTGYSVGCAAVWAAILLLARRRLDEQARHELQIVCGGWWMGWTSATIARIGYPPPEPLTASAHRRLRTGSAGLVALGLAAVVRTLARGTRPAGR